MKTILVPVDYSETARNAAFYALSLAEQLGAERLILYNAFQPPVPVDPVGITTDGNFNTIALYDVENLSENNKVHLDHLKREISNTYNGNIAVETISEYNILRDGIADICLSQDIAMIVMGITEGDKLTETLVGSNSLDVAKHTTTPVIIVPHDTTYKPIRQVLFTCDYKDVSKTVPVALLRNILAATGAHLQVLHVDANAETGEHLQQADALKDLLNDITVDYHAMQHTDFKEAVNQFAAAHNIDLIVAVPRRHSFFEGLFHHSHVKTLAFHSHIPLLLIHE